jgi:hypothetical protein
MQQGGNIYQFAEHCGCLPEDLVKQALAMKGHLNMCVIGFLALGILLT